MKLTGIRQMALFDAPDPAIHRPTDVLVKMGAVGVCGSDVHYYTTGRIGSQVVEYPFTVGHECAGTVVEIGAEVSEVKPGDRVAIEPGVACGDCDQCRGGRENTCRRHRFLGCPGPAEGALSEYLVMPQECCFAISDEVGFGAATISEPLAIGIYAVGQSIPMPGAKVGILGLGPIGRTVLLPAVADGCEVVYATDRVDVRCAAGRVAGATWVGNPDRDDVVAQILNQEPLGLDVVFECCGQQAALDQAVELLRPGGKLMIVGIPETERISFDPDKLRRKELAVVHVRRQRGCVTAALDMVGRHPSQIDALITHRAPFAESQ
ncbi:MAG: alcohol dehydrogenase catalytic domain-containing protein, partial [Planctomycetota bacterium]